MSLVNAYLIGREIMKHVWLSDKETSAIAEKAKEMQTKILYLIHVINCKTEGR